MSTSGAPTEATATQDLNTLLEGLEGELAVVFARREVDFTAEAAANAVSVATSVIERTPSSSPYKGKQKARILYVLGKAYALIPTGADETIDLLSRSVKLDPENEDAWNVLGAHYFERGDVNTAASCFVGALTFKTNQVSLRNLSVATRQLPTVDADERKANFMESVRLAKAAVAEDETDGFSWFVLGNAHLFEFFEMSSAVDASGLDSALSAYARAEECGGDAARNPDLHFNRGMVLRYLERYNEAVEAFEHAAKLNPDSNNCKEAINKITKHLTRAADYIERGGRMKPRRLAESVSKLSTDDQLLGRQRVVLSNLEVGENAGVAVSVRVLALVNNQNPVPQCFVVADAESCLVCVSVYNVIENVIKENDELWLTDPVMETVEGVFGGKEISYRCIRARKPWELAIDGVPLPEESVAKSELRANSAE